MQTILPCTLQVQADSLPKAKTKIVLALQQKTNGHGGLFAIEGNGGSTDKRTLRVSGTVALRKGWTVAVKVFTLKDKKWTANSQSGFSCHMLKTFDGCTKEQISRSFAQVFAFMNESTYSHVNASDTTTLASPIEDVHNQHDTAAADDATSRRSQLLTTILIVMWIIY